MNPLALSADGELLFVANTASGTVSVLDVRKQKKPRLRAEIPVGIDPVGIAVRPKRNPGDSREDELIFVTNHISDTISVISRQKLDVVQTVQGLDAEGVTTTDEPSGIVFAGPSRAFVALDQNNQVLMLDIDAQGRAHMRGQRLPITAQAPRAVAVSGDRLYVAAFESGNETELPTCGSGDDRGFSPGDPHDEGCMFNLELIKRIVAFPPGGGLFDVELGTVFDFAAVNPNIGGEVIIDRDRPDRDIFVFDLAAPDLDSDPLKPGIQPLQVIERVGTLLYGLAASSNGWLYITNTDARNDRDGLLALGNRMFDNRLTMLDCSTGWCGPPQHIDLDRAAGTGATVPTPYGVAVSRDGQTVVVTGAGSDGLKPNAPGTPPGQPDLWGLAVLDARGRVHSGARLGAIPQGVAVLSDTKTGRAEAAFVLNSVGGSVDVVKLDPPKNSKKGKKSKKIKKAKVIARVAVGNDPTPPEVKAGRIQFMSARASTNGTFSCESCHPNGNIDQVLWTINALEDPKDGEFAVEIPEPRTTMPIRGLRDTLPLHWEGNLADPFPDDGVPGDPAPDCDLEVDGEIGCMRHLVNASLSGVMCAQVSGCPTGPTGLPGALTDTQRNQMAAFMASVPYPPSPNRRPTDALSDMAMLGVQDFFTDEDGAGVADGIGPALNFAPVTCADNALGCHSLPLTVGTNSSTVGGFDAPSIRGMTDRHVHFSNGIGSSEEALRAFQACANGVLPPAKQIDTGGLFELQILGDPCDLRLFNPIIGDLTETLLGFPLAELDFPSGAEIYDPEVGFTERGLFLSFFEGLFALVYGVRGDRIWEYQTEVSVGLPGLTGRQVEVTPTNATDPDVAAAVAQLEDAARVGKITAVAHNARLGEFRFVPGQALWASGATRLSGAELRALAAKRGEVLTLTAHLPENISIGGEDRQPLLNIDPDVLAAEIESGSGQVPGMPRPQAGERAEFRLGARYVAPGATLLVNGTACTSCSLTPATADNGEPAVDVVLQPGLAPGVAVVQVLNPNGWASNEMPLCVQGFDGTDERCCPAGFVFTEDGHKRCIRER